MVKRGTRSRPSAFRFSIPPASRSMTHSTRTISAPAARRSLHDITTWPPEVTTSSTTHSRWPCSSPPSASLAVPYDFASLRTKRVGRPVTCDRTVAIGTPPSSKPASASIPAGTDGAMASHSSRSSGGSASNRYLSKYSLLTAPERSVKVPVMWAHWWTRRARSFVSVGTAVDGSLTAVEEVPVSAQDLIRWSEALSGIARTGLGFTQSLYERERFEEVLKVAADMRVAAGHELQAETLLEEWMNIVGDGVAGYVTPKVAVGAVVGNDRGEILLVQRGDSGIWLYPTGWADIGYSPSEVAVKEVLEETGIECVPERIISVLDGLRLGFTQIPLYSLVFFCRAVGGELKAHPLERREVGWCAEAALPAPMAGADGWAPAAFAAIRGDPMEVTFDPPREPSW